MLSFRAHTKAAENNKEPWKRQQKEDSQEISNHQIRFLAHFVQISFNALKEQI